jgi:hypothetical protein
MPKTIAIRNPRVLKVVARAVNDGVGRNAVEAAEYLIERGMGAVDLQAASGPHADQATSLRNQIAAAEADAFPAA